MQLTANSMTPTGYHQIEQEITRLELDRPNRIKQLQEARALGDLSENAEYSAAKRDLRHLESRLRYLNKLLQYAEVVTPETPDQVEVGKHVDVQFDDENDTNAYQIVGKFEADLDANKISFDSPLGHAMIDHKVGDTVTVKAPNGDYQVTIRKIKS
ncbi:MAG: transcription elongation factor GreA [Furfurilactobacillus sp.]|jgi:transcription elongation factor GreA|uniref:transcription elongation factor GreA n=1 Tax=Furfurilactobacillus TaxID=2767882 RepID=UPI001EEDBC7E|nr:MULTISPECIES: transcription elongation factor GreA [Furfurilactobacillus]MCF6418561.1 transcription elongation factor GreA [Furfurilactobacillus milii]MCH4012058.1 transcription elongation factor GreA [Furfurilactobacillus sp.]MCH4037950.1 transcription elongation factor GreA [Furfurilactobacillus sp.]MCH4115413.1 transcription elongation factor GreA [Furfurilactobacillus sp.]MCI1341030.1 transcription elongation factor GreA [Furfurilactobacillus sp.]